jgi:hypothetical protein
LAKENIAATRIAGELFHAACVVFAVENGDATGAPSNLNHGTSVYTEYVALATSAVYQPGTMANCLRE